MGIPRVTVPYDCLAKKTVVGNLSWFATADTSTTSSSRTIPAIKRRCASLLAFKSCRTAAVALSGIELAHRIRKQQIWIDLKEEGLSTQDCSPKQLWDRALSGQFVLAGRPGHLPPLMHHSSPACSERTSRVRIHAPQRYPRKVFSGARDRI
jgi:hypothetical protein